VNHPIFDFYNRTLKATGSPKKARRMLRHEVQRQVLRHGLSRGLKARATNGALRAYAKKIAITAVSGVRRATAGGGM
jgi:hypothetical protein